MRFAIPGNADSSASKARLNTAAGVAILHGDAREHFWRVYLRAGLGLLGAETVVILGYLLSTPDGTHRQALLIVTGLILAVVTSLIPVVPRIAAKRWRVRFGLAMTLLACLTLTLCSLWDGGIDSPLLDMITLPVMWAAVGLTPRSVAVCSLASLADIGIVGANDSRVSAPAQHVGMLFAVVIGVGVLAYVTSVNRARLERKEASLAAELALLADTDGLTGCFNHRVFERSLAAEIDRALRHGTPLSLLVADVDLLKSVNDSRGHAAGDLALATIGMVLRDNTRSFDQAARIGGDEFAVILPNTELLAASVIAQRISDAFDAATDGQVSLSIGVASLDVMAPTAKRLTRDADVAMYAAKATGRHHVETSSHVLGAYSDREQAMFAELAGPEDRVRLEERVRRADQETARATTLLDTLLSSAPIGLGFVDRDCRIVRLNATLAAINGSTIEEQIGRSVDEVIPEMWPKIKDAFRRVLDDGVELLNIEVDGESSADPNNVQHYWLASFYPVRLGTDIIGVGTVVVDITDRRLWEIRRAAFTHKAVAALAATIEARDPYTAGHQRAVADIAAAIAAELGVDAFAVEGIHLAATIHDIGKIAIPAEILNRPGELSRIEMEMVRAHCQIGFDILAGVDFPWPVREMVLQHHERQDGSGYPFGLRGEQIELGARIIAVADVVDAMSSHRPYRAAVGLSAAVETIKAGRGTLFDPEVVDACVRLLRRKPESLRSVWSEGATLVALPRDGRRAGTAVSG